MANEQDLVKEIEEALGIMEEHQARLHTEKEAHGWETHVKQAITHAEGAIILSTLQRVREALRWIPVTERLPEATGYYRVSTTGTRFVHFCFFNKDEGVWYTGNYDVLAWQENPAPYTPEEK